MNKRTMYIAAGVAVAGAALWYFFLRKKEPAAQVATVAGNLSTVGGQGAAGAAMPLVQGTVLGPPPASRMTKATAVDGALALSILSPSTPGGNRPPYRAVPDTAYKPVRP